MKIMLDFDGTMVEHRYPKIGKDVPGAIDVVNKLYAKGHKIIINTFRVNLDVNQVIGACDYLSKKLSIGKLDLMVSKVNPGPWNLDGIDINDDDEIIFIDDSSDYVPLIKDSEGKACMVNCKQIESQLIEKGIL